VARLAQESLVTWTITPRDADLGRTLDEVSIWDSLTVVERYNQVSTWVLEGPAELLNVFTPDMGCILDKDGEQRLSGIVRAIDRVYETDDEGRVVDRVTLGFVEDSAPLWWRLCWPDPSHALSTTMSTFSAAHDVRSGARETILLGYIGANLGPAAPIASRRLPGLVLPTSSGRGGSTTWQARMDVLGDVVASLAEAAGLRVRIVHDEPSPSAPRLLLEVTEVTDRSANVVFGGPDAARAMGSIDSFRYSLSAPEVTAAIAFAAGELTAREAAMQVDATAESIWNRRVEGLVDQRQTDDQAVVDDALTKRLEEGATPTTTAFQVSPTGGLEYGTDFFLGDVVGVELPGVPLEISDRRLREVSTTIRPGQADEVSLVVGAPGAESRSTSTAAKLNRVLRRLAMIERSR
jgi:hypothetical protein